jgi:hypothetical protein
MPKKIRTWEDQLKHLKKKKKPNPMQKISGMKKEHIIQNHDELLKQIHEDLDTLAQRKFWDDPKATPFTKVGIISSNKTVPSFHSKTDEKSLIMVDVQHDFCHPAEVKSIKPIINSYQVVTKGSNMFTEHYAVFADVPDPKDPSTQLNTPFIEEADVIIFSGERHLNPVLLSHPPFPYEGVNPSEDPDWESKVAFMRADLECGMGYTRIIETVRTRMKEDGKDFDAEFKKWKEKKDATI